MESACISSSRWMDEDNSVYVHNWNYATLLLCLMFSCPAHFILASFCADNFLVTLTNLMVSWHAMVTDNWPFDKI